MANQDYVIVPAAGSGGSTTGGATEGTLEDVLTELQTISAQNSDIIDLLTAQVALLQDIVTNGVAIKDQPIEIIAVTT